MNETRIIKKYPNRRLYDTAISSYITLEDVRRLVVEQIAIQVIDARTQEDITHGTLLQIIVEQEEKGPSMFSIDSLQNMIRTYGDSMQMWMGKMFEQSMELFSAQQKMFRNDLQNEGWENKDPSKLLSDMAQQNMAHWQKWQQQWLKSFSEGKQNDMANRFSDDTEENDSLKRA